MRVPYLWLKEYLYNMNVTPDEIARRLTLAGVEAETVDDFNPGIGGVVAGVIENIKAFPGKDNLTILSVNAGEHSSRQIVCGAPNVKIGQRVFLALPGSTLPGDRRIEEIEFQGIVSEGMLCSAKELGLDLVQEDDGILTMDEYVSAGTDMVEYLEIDDKIITLDLTPNRADCLGLVGVARELAALLEDRLRMPSERRSFESDEIIENVVSVEIKDEILCPRYTARVIRDINIKPSPLWLQVRLLKAGIRPISNIVDVTNYVMWEYGQPLHAFDYQLVDSGTIIVRRAEEGESLITIDGVERSLNSDTLVIADSNKPIALAGVMGGKNTEISLQTKDVLLEAAYFDPITTRRTARNLGLISEASLRFEKGVNPERMVDALDRAAGMMSELADGKMIGGIADCYPRAFVQDVVEISPERVEYILGTGIPAERMVGIL
ncbi:MAG: phenylalanine--tRNA ligase subunit beta, partial [Firmicutes bacterium]|nr:phenylalanine--tRNA ligase subunit beta [Bacillota bacterium]